MQNRVVRGAGLQAALAAPWDGRRGQAHRTPSHFDFRQAVEIHTRGAALHSEENLVGLSLERHNIYSASAVHCGAIGDIVGGPGYPCANAEILGGTETPHYTSLNLGKIPLQ